MKEIERYWFLVYEPTTDYYYPVVTGTILSRLWKANSMLGKGNKPTFTDIFLTLGIVTISNVDDIEFPYQRIELSQTRYTLGGRPFKELIYS